MPVAWISTRSVPRTLPATRPITTTDFACTSALIAPLAPIVSWLLGSVTLPSTLPSITRSSSPVRSPEIVIDLPMFAVVSFPSRSRSRGTGLNAGSTRCAAVDGGGNAAAASSRSSFFPNRLTGVVDSGWGTRGRSLPQRGDVSDVDVAVAQDRTLGAVERRHRGPIGAERADLVALARHERLLALEHVERGRFAVLQPDLLGAQLLRGRFARAARGHDALLRGREVARGLPHLDHDLLLEAVLARARARERELAARGVRARGAVGDRNRELRACHGLGRPVVVVVGVVEPAL